MDQKISTDAWQLILLSCPAIACSPCIGNLNTKKIRVMKLCTYSVFMKAVSTCVLGGGELQGKGKFMVTARVPAARLLTQMSIVSVLLHIYHFPSDQLASKDGN